MTASEHRCGLMCRGAGRYRPRDQGEAAVFSNDLAAELDVGGGRRKEALQRRLSLDHYAAVVVEGAVVGNLSLFARNGTFSMTMK